ncbi:MAG: glycine--tRNA ligase subunit beta [Spirochaetes bacterium]|nr:glycine--tRNA ligase subunit beta [Spirochaetota bacterium]
MWEKYNFLCEFGTEEIPAGYIPVAADNFKKMMQTGLDELRVDYDTVNVYATPRRIIIAASEVAAMQKEQTIELKGPSADKAYEADGSMSKALQGFLRGNGLSEKELEKVETEKGTYLYGRKQAPVSSTEEILPELIKKMLFEIPFPKKMKWNTKELTFPRPLKYLFALYNDRKINLQFDGFTADNITRGHYIQFPEMYKVDKISDYENFLQNKAVMVDQNKRKEIIRKQLKAAAEKCGGSLIEDEDLLDTVTYLVEDPHVVDCSFSTDFLEIPDVVLIAEMKEHQKYFAVTDKNGKLINKFLVISNNPATEFIRQGNERVINARFSDAKFFFDEDKKTKLIDKTESLKDVVFHKDLGSIFDKVMRVENIAVKIAEMTGKTAILDKIKRAVLLSKADLNTALVFEFTSLQGQIGRIYALRDGEDADVADAINSHYKPRFQGDSLPENDISVIVSLAEKFDNILGSYSVGNIPKGSQDPYALRRQAHAIVELVISKKINIEIDNLYDLIAGSYKNADKFKVQILDFITTRAKTFFTDHSITYDEFDASIAVNNYDFYEMFCKASSLHDFRQDAGFSEMIMAFKRMNNIISAFLKKSPDYVFKKTDEALLKSTEEKALFSFFKSKETEIGKYISERNYKSLFSVIIAGKKAIDDFFDKVMVMDEDEKVRDNRLALLRSITLHLSSLFDVTKIAD